MRDPAVIRRMFKSALKPSTRRPILHTVMKRGELSVGAIAECGRLALEHVGPPQPRRPRRRDRLPQRREDPAYLGQAAMPS